jgi:hypothetical protein
MPYTGIFGVHSYHIVVYFVHAASDILKHIQAVIYVVYVGSEIMSELYLILNMIYNKLFETAAVGAAEKVREIMANNSQFY